MLSEKVAERKKGNEVVEESVHRVLINNTEMQENSDGQRCSSCYSVETDGLADEVEIQP
jgi:hypothetical protein